MNIKMTDEIFERVFFVTEFCIRELNKRTGASIGFSVNPEKDSIKIDLLDPETGYTDARVLDKELFKNVDRRIQDSICMFYGAFHSGLKKQKSILRSRS